MSISSGAQKTKLIVIAGPTAAGKTDLALRLAKYCTAELVSADSRQVYKGLDIGTAKPQGRKIKKYGSSAVSVKGVPIFLMDLITPSKIFTVSEFQKQAREVITKIDGAGKVPILVGGTGLYIQAVTENLLLPAVAPDYKLRRKLEAEWQKNGLKSLYKKLLKLDPGTRKFIDPKNPRRVIRALEVVMKTGQPFSTARQRGESEYDTLFLVLDVPREKLYKKINSRVDEMVKKGLLKEVKAAAKKYGWNAPGLNALGYRQFKDYFDGKRTLEDVTDEVKKQSRHYAKRQITWFKKQPDVIWIKSYADATKQVSLFLKPVGRTK